MSKKKLMDKRILTIFIIIAVFGGALLFLEGNLLNILQYEEGGATIIVDAVKYIFPDGESENRYEIAVSVINYPGMELEVPPDYIHDPPVIYCESVTLEGLGIVYDEDIQDVFVVRTINRITFDAMMYESDFSLTFVVNAFLIDEARGDGIVYDKVNFRIFIDGYGSDITTDFVACNVFGDVVTIEPSEGVTETTDTIYTSPTSFSSTATASGMSLMMAIIYLLFITVISLVERKQKNI